MSYLRLLAEAVTLNEGTGHVVYDFGVGAVVTALMIFKGVEIGRSLGLLPEKDERSDRGKTVGKLHVISFKHILKEQIAESASQNKEILISIHLRLCEIATILRERK